MAYIKTSMTTNLSPSLGDAINPQDISNVKDPIKVEVINIPDDKARNEDKPRFELEEHPIDQVRDLTVAVIGASISGIIAGVLLPAKLPGIDLRIYDKNADVGGTCLNTQWTEEFSQGDEIKQYWQDVAKKYDVYKYLKSGKWVESAEWLPGPGKWKITFQDLISKKFYDDFVDVLIPAIGHFNAWKLPDYSGRDNYKGFLFHSSDWNHDINLNDKRVALIGMVHRVCRYYGPFSLLQATLIITLVIVPGSWTLLDPRAYES